MYYTSDWQSAAQSLKLLANLEPDIAATGHGVPLRGASMRSELNALARDFELQAVPQHGRYVNTPVITDRNGVVSVPPELPELLPTLLLEDDGVARFLKTFLGEDAVCL